MLKFWPVFILFFVSCSQAQENENTPQKKKTKEQSADSLSYLALGDSYTIGESVEASLRYPNILQDLLNEKGVKMKAPEIIAVTGWTTADLQKGIENAQINGKTYDLVSLLIGVNNQYQGRSLEEYKKEYTQLLKQAIAFAGNDTSSVFILSIPDYGFTPFGAKNKEKISKEIDEFNAACKAITESMNVSFYNITDISRKTEKQPELVAKDNLHPSGKMYRLWMERILGDIIKKSNSH